MMDIEQARQMLRHARKYRENGTLEAYERLVDDLLEVLEGRKEIDASKVSTTLVDTSTLCITGMKVLTILAEGDANEPSNQD